MKIKRLIQLDTNTKPCIGTIRNGFSKSFVIVTKMFMVVIGSTGRWEIVMGRIQ